MSNEQTRFQGEHKGNAPAIKAKALAPIDAIRNDLALMETELKKVLPPHVTVEKFSRIAMTAIQKTPELLNVDKKTLLQSCMLCAQDGLLPDGREAAFTIFAGKAVYMPMVGGILKKIRNSGELASITSQVIMENDKFRYWVDGDGEHLEHEPKLFGARGQLIGTYALAKTKDGAVYIEVMTEDQIQDVRNVSKAKNGPWNGPFADEMRRKTAIRRLSKRLPMSTDIEKVIQRDDDMFEFDSKKNAAASAPSVALDVSARLDAIEAPTAEVLPAEVKPALIFKAGRFQGQSLGDIKTSDLQTYHSQLKSKAQLDGPDADRDEAIALMDQFFAQEGV